MSTGVDPRAGLEELADADCMRLVESSTLGRLAVVIDGQPLVFPVNFTVDCRAIARAAVRITMAVRELDPYAASINVAVVSGAEGDN